MLFNLVDKSKPRFNSLKMMSGAGGGKQQKKNPNFKNNASI